ncbi:MAG: aldehyde dehydrogenase family protein [Acidobacteriota bacterium]|nr:aldehyde dehydrogenase family protein [Acidobacteriota bacterium]
MRSRRSSGRWCPCSLSARRPRRSRRPTTRSTGSPRGSGPTRAPRRSRSRARCAPASSGRTPTTTSTRPPPSAATRSRASGARAGRPGYARICGWCASHAAGGAGGLGGALAVDRLPVRKTYKLWIGGAFVRSESGRSDIVGDFNIPRGSRKDVRDAVAAARRAAGPWAARTAYNRGQILYRAAEALESRRAQLTAVLDGDGGAEELDAAVDVLVHYAGWTDKLQPVLGGINPVAAPFLSFSLPEPTGVVGIVAPDLPPLLGLVAELGPALAAGNTVVAILSEGAPHAGLDLAEALGVADIPAGVVNLLSGRRDELAVPLGGHRDLNAIVDASGDDALGTDLDRLAAETIKRASHHAAASGYDEAVEYALERIAAVTELKTAWHPVGA